MATAKKSTLKAKSARLPEQEEDASGNGQTERSLYADFSIWKDKKKPKWHPVKKMRYVFFRMSGGCTITDALREIKWSASEFWHLIDLERNTPFRLEYQRAKILQGRAFGDAVMFIAEGRDPVTKRNLIKTRKMIEKALRRAGKQKTQLAMRAVIENLIGRMEMNDKGILSRNKLQIDGAKWMAKTQNPSEFSEKSSMSLTGGDGEGGTGAPISIMVQFVDKNGKPVTPS